MDKSYTQLWIDKMSQSIDESLTEIYDTAHDDDEWNIDFDGELQEFAVRSWCSNGCYSDCYALR